jgi:hypothetical protein
MVRNDGRMRIERSKRDASKVRRREPLSQIEESTARDCATGSAGKVMLI